MSTISASTTSTTAYKVTADTTGTLVLQTGSTPTTAVTVGTDQSVTFAQSANLPNTFGFKNRIINGAMVIDQRYNGAATANTINDFVLDRWLIVQSVTGKLIAQRNAGSVTPPVGFTNYFGITSQSAYSVLSTDRYMIQQAIEGYNTADLAWGTANAATITLSFWVRSSLTGTFGGAVISGTSSRGYAFNYTISSANTWEFKTVTIPGDQSGTWATDNNSSLVLRFGLGSGSNYTVSANSWQAANPVQPTGTVSVVGTNAATFYITGVQLEKGSTATSFDYRPYGTELSLCQRYYFKISSTNNTPLINLQVWTTTSVYGVMPLKVTMRSNTPSMSYSALSDFLYYTNGNSYTPTGISMDRYNQDNIELNMSFGSSVGSVGGWVRMPGTTGWMSFSAEL